MSPTNQPTKAPTAFQRRVFEALANVPRGKTTTYGAIADAISCGSAQAIGQALRRNPDAPRIPCHRVVRNDGSIGGFFGENDPFATAKKRALLKAEGVAFDASGRVEAAFILRQL
ncbi:MGMT family protein [bacterium]|nr:MGMT family protein [bacterium]NBS52712.1 MGMT family protein [Spartobacteria bacterium]